MISYKLAIIAAIAFAGLVGGSVYLLSVRPTNNPTKVLNEKVLGSTSEASSSALPMITPTITPKAKTTPIQIAQPVIDSNAQQAEIPSPLPRQDSSKRIEICRAEARNEKTKYIETENSKFDPKIAELANTRNNAETQQVALNYGYIKESDIVNGTAFYDKARNDGFSISQAESIAMNAVSVWETYLRNLHDWALKGVNDYGSRVESSAATYENNYYLKCLNE